MLICLPCYLQTDPEAATDPFNEWETAQKIYDQCAICERTTLCAELD